MRTFLWLYLAGALVMPGRPFYAVLYLVGGVYLLARLSLEHGVKRLRTDRILSDRKIFPGEEIRVTLRFRNLTAVPIPWIQFSESRPQPLATEPFSGVVTLAAGGTGTVAYSLLGARRGRYRLGPMSLRAGDPFGFARLDLHVPGSETVTVYPRVCPLPELGLPARLPMGDLSTRRRLFEDPAWLAGTRPYAPGDPLKRIHWSATARTGELMVRQFRHAMLLPACVMVNLNQPEYEPKQFWARSELAVTAAASLFHYLIGEKQQVALVATGADPEEGEGPVRLPSGHGAGPVRLPPGHGAGLVRLPLRQGAGAAMEALEVLARIQAAPTMPFARTVADEAQRMPWGTLLCLITPAETPEIASLCARLSRGGQQVLLFVLDGASDRRPGYQVWALSEGRAGEVVLG